MKLKNREENVYTEIGKKTEASVNEALCGQLTIFAQEENNVECPEMLPAERLIDRQQQAASNEDVYAQENLKQNITEMTESVCGQACTAPPVSGDIGTEQADTASSLGKFGSAEELLSAYNALEAEFTKRCQRLKQLAGEVELLRKTQVTEKQLEQTFSDLLSDSAFVEENILSNEDIRNRVIAGYLRALEENKGAKVLMDSCGYSVLAPAKKPKTLSEAKKLADQFIRG